MIQYEAFGLTFETSAPFPGRDAASGPLSENAIRVELGPVPRMLRDAEYEDEMVQASATEYLFRSDLLKMYVAEGRRIVVEQLGPQDPAALWNLIFGVGASIAGLQRGLVALHASAIAVNSRCVAFAGQSGAGKSTLAASLVELGYPLLSDDLCLMHPRADGNVMVGSGTRELRLTEETAGLFRSQDESMHSTPFDGKLVFRPAQTDRQGGSFPLGLIYTLDFANESSAPGIFRLEGVAALEALVGGLRLRPGLLKMKNAADVFRSLAAIYAAVPIFRFVRPRDHGQLRHWTSLLVRHFEGFSVPLSGRYDQ